jgi:hypothetical protein
MLNDASQADPIVDRAAAALRDVAVPDGPPAAVVAAVRESGRGVVLRERHPIRRRAVLFGLAAAAAVMLVSGLLPSLQSARRSAPGFALRSSVAFGDVIGELRKVRTVKYRETTTQNDEPASVSLETVAMDGRYSRSEMLDDKGNVRNWAIYNAGRMLNVDPVAKTASLMDYTTDDGLPHSLGDQHTLADLLNIDPPRAKPLGEREFDGRRLVGFRVNRDYDKRNLRSVDVWVDARTRLPMRVEQTVRMRYPDDAGAAELNRRTKNGTAPLPPEEAEKLMDEWPWQKTTIVMTEIQFNVPVDESTFSIEPPKGYEFTETKVQGPRVH